MATKKLTKILQRRVDNLDNAPSSLDGGVVSAQKELLAEVLGLMNNLSLNDDGSIKVITANLKKIDTVISKTARVLNSGAYKKAIESFSDEFVGQQALNNEYFKELFGESFVFKQNYKKLFEASQANALELLRKDHLTSLVAEPLQKSLKSAVFIEQDFKDTVKQVTKFIKGSAEVDGQLLRHVKRISRDAFSISDREYVKALSEDLGIEWYQYIGGKVKDSRKFCIQRNGKYFHTKEIEEWGHKPKDWKGRNASTNDSNIFSLLGGWNCLHVIAPLTVDVVPDSVIQRNINKGNYKRAA